MVGLNLQIMPTELEKSFHIAMLNIYRSAKAEAGYNATRFLGSVSERGGYETARILLHASTVSDGYTALWERNRLDLTVEALILKSEWHDLFSDAERDIARQRLIDYGYDVSLLDS
jgi:hypothetical protein